MLNNVMIQGNLTAKPEVKIGQSGKAYSHFTIACNQGYGEKQSVDYIDCVAFESTAEFIARNFEKGSQILIEGSLHNNNYTNKSGTTQYSYQVIVKNVYFCGYKKSESNSVVCTPAKAPEEVGIQKVSASEMKNFLNSDEGDAIYF